MKTTVKTKVCMIIGDPVEHSLSPRMHNAGYDALSLDFVFIGSNVKKEDLKEAIGGIRALGIKGVSVTIPHKLEVVNHLDEVDEIAEKIGSVNTIVNEDGILKGYNTDWLGITKPLERLIALKGKKVLVLGAGGAARAAIYGLLKSEAKVAVYNRTLEKGVRLADEFGIISAMEILDNIKTMDIVINATSLGLNEDDELPVPIEYINSNQIIFDLVYTKNGKTKFIEEAEKKGAQAITGTEMLLEQGYKQFKLFTGHEAPKDAMRKALL